MAEDTLTSETCHELLRHQCGFHYARTEKTRPWGKRMKFGPDGRPMRHPFINSSTELSLWDLSGGIMRLWDHYSGSPLLDDGSMLARDDRGRLDTVELRTSTLKIHADHAIWEDTPYISFTSFASSIEDLARSRSERVEKCEQYLTVVDPRVRLRKGLPILHFKDEMRDYRIQDPYGREYLYYQDHYLCLWEVTPEEVVGTWKWKNVCQNPNWYEEIIVPAVKQFPIDRDIQEAPPAPVNAPSRSSTMPLNLSFVDASDEEAGSVNNDGPLLDSTADSDNEANFGYDGYSSDDSYERVCEDHIADDLVRMLEDNL